MRLIGADDASEGTHVADKGNNYKNTMNLPQTDFPMRGNLPANEPKRLEKWEQEHLYERILEKNKDGEPFILHDGPPYANGPIHIGHAFNKILKDFVVKSHAQRGFFTPYIPGWDCHGQPIEHEVEKKLGTEKMREMPQSEVRKLCREWAERFVDRSIAAASRSTGASIATPHSPRPRSSTPTRRRRPSTCASSCSRCPRRSRRRASSWTMPTS